MANYIGQTFQAPTQRQDENFGLLTTVMQMKQGKYDANKTAIQQTLNAFGQLQVLRPEDNQYIASKLSSLENELGSMGSLDLSKASHVDPVMNKVKSAARDPFILNALENTQKFRGFQAQVEKLKEKSPDKYSDTNYGFALSQAGFQDYMSGKADKIGSLNYTEYVNVQKNMADRAKEFAKFKGEEQLIGSQQHGNYHTVDIYGKIVRKDELQNYLMESLDEKERKQLQINAWNNFQGKDDKGVSEYMLSVSNERLKDLESDYGTLKAKADSGTKGLDDQLSMYQEAIKNQKAKINTNSFTRDDAYNDYINKSVSSIADAFDMNIVTKKDVDKTLFDETKFLYDQQQDAIKLAMKQQELDLKKQENKLTEIGLFGGTRTDLLQPTEGQTPEADTTVLSRELAQTSASLDTYLSKVDPEYAKMSVDEKWNYRIGLDLSNPANSKIQITPELRKLHTSFSQSRNALVKINEQVTSNIKSTARGSFEDMMEGAIKSNELDLDSTAKYMPVTSSILKSARNGKKQISFDDLTADQQRLVQIELTKAWMKEKGSDLDKDTKDVTNRAIVTLERGVKDKNLLNSSNSVTSKVAEEKGFLDTLVSAVSTPFYGGKYALGVAGNTVSDIYNRITEGEKYASDRWNVSNNENEKTKQQFLESLSSQFKINPASLIVFPFKAGYNAITKEDSSLSDINARDVGRGIGVGERFDGLFETVKTESRRVATEMSPTLQSKYGYTFSTELKGQKDIAEYLKAAVLTSEDISSGAVKLPTGTNAFTVQREGEQFRIFFNAGTGKDVSRTSVLVSNLPDQVKGVLDLTEDSWSNSAYNPNLNLTPVQIQPVTSYEDGRQKASRLATAFGDQLPIQVQSVVADTKNGILKPSIEYTRQDIQEEIYQKNKQVVDKFLNQTFIAEPFRTPDGRFATNIKYTIVQPNGEEEQAEESITHAVNEKNDMVFLLDYFSKVDQIKKEQLKRYK